MRRDKLDTVFSAAIREAHDYTCAWCGKNYRERPGALHCSHLFSRSHKSIRCHSLNAVAHCFPCHQKFGGNPIEGGSWARKYLGETGYERLLELKNDRTFRWTQPVRDELYAHWKAEYERIMGMRKQGVTGFIRLVDYQ